MTHRFSRSIPLFIMTAFLSLPAFAQTQADGVPEFIPASGWNVGPSSMESGRGLKGGKLPCVMAGEFNNGFVVRFSGGNREMLAMAIDFRQDVFRQGGRYAASVSVDGGMPASVQGSAFTPSILVFNLRSTSGFYNALMGGRLMELAIGTNKMRFYLNNVTEGLQKLEACYSGGPATTGAPQMADASMNAMPTSLSDIQSAPADAPQWQAPASNEVYIRRDGSREEVPSRKMDGMMKSGNEGMKTMWSADAGESIQDVLARWSQQAGMQLDWQAGKGGQVKKDFRMSGTVNDAVASLINENTDGANLKGHTQTAAGAQSLQPQPGTHDGVSASPRYSAQSSASNYVPSAAAGAPASAYAGTGGSWSAASGASLKTVLQSWSARNNVELMWNAAYDYPVKSAITQSGSFESALQSALGQYQSDNDRPVGRLNTDPSTGKKLLIIDTDRSL
jgi:hypothetical protein